MARRLAAVALAVLVLALGAVAWAAWAPLPSGPREIEYVIPEGTGARQARGETVNVLPARMRFTLGVRDVLVIRNADVTPASFGPAVLAPGQTYRIPFTVPVEFQLACSIHPSGTITIAVAPAPAPGFPRLRWRVANLGGA